jgi:hypothetical protein
MECKMLSVPFILNRVHTIQEQELMDTIKRAVHRDRWPRVENYWMCRTKHHYVLQHLIRKTNLSSVFHLKILWPFLFFFTLFLFAFLRIYFE